MPKLVRTALPLVLLAVVYSSSVPAFSAMQPASAREWNLPSWTLLTWMVWAGVLMLVSGANMVNAYLIRSERSASQLALWGMALKICMVPFYLVGFINGALISLLLVVAPGLFVLIPFQVAVMATVGFAPLLATSSYGIASALRAQQEGLIGYGLMVGLIVLQLLFVTDFVASIILYVRLRRATWPASGDPPNIRL